MADLCRMCGMPVHRYSPDHPEHGPEGRWDAMGCVNSLKSEVERLRANDDALKSTCAYAAAALMQLEFGDHESESETLTHQLISALTWTAGQTRVDALLADQAET